MEFSQNWNRFIHGLRANRSTYRKQSVVPLHRHNRFMTHDDMCLLASPERQFHLEALAKCYYLNVENRLRVAVFRS